ncbi:hypothetical protein D3C83_14030 [compost metagenome]
MFNPAPSFSLMRAFTLNSRAGKLNTNSVITLSTDLYIASSRNPSWAVANVYAGQYSTRRFYPIIHGEAGPFQHVTKRCQGRLRSETVLMP